MGQKLPSRSFVTPEFRMSFPHLITAHPYMQDGKPTGKEAYQTECIFPEDAMGQFKSYDENTQKYVDVNFPAAIAQLGNEAWPNLIHPMTGAKITLAQLFNEVQAGKGWPLRKGDVVKAQKEAKGKNGDHYAGMRVMSIKSNKIDTVQPPVLSMVTGANTFKVLERSNDADMAKAKTLFSGGNYAFATISVVANIVSGTHFLTAYVNGIRFTRAGKSLGGASEMDRFDGVHGGSSAHNPAAGMDEEIPF